MCCCVVNLKLTRVPGLPIRDYLGDHDNCAPRRSKMSAIDVTVKTFFERLYLVPRLKPICALDRSHTPTITLHLFLDFVNVFPKWPFSFFGHDRDLTLPQVPLRGGPWDSLRV